MYYENFGYILILDIQYRYYKNTGIYDTDIQLLAKLFRNSVVDLKYRIEN